MGVEVVHNKDNSVTTGITDIHQIFDLCSSVKGSRMLPNAYVPYATERFYKYKDAAGAVPDVSRINLLCIP